MKLLLDECVTRRLKPEFIGHEVRTVDEAGLKGLKNGELLRAASGVFEVLVTVDQNLAHQQNIRSFDIAVLIMIARKNTYDALKPLMPRTLQALKQIKPGDIHRVG
jgi:predicted nuclease of predicted toxin-antitoxin system